MRNRVPLVFAILTLNGLSYPKLSFADDTIATVAACKALKDEVARLQCFDRITLDRTMPVTGDSKDGCKIEDWSYTEKADNIYINGSTSCEKGKLTYRLYDGKTHKFIASNFTYIEGFAFQSYTDGVVPSSLEIKYTIDIR
jgi:hypothetical protein